ncbi:MAG: DUF2341 domain-containing protein [bacterium]
MNVQTRGLGMGWQSGAVTRLLAIGVLAVLLAGSSQAAFMQIRFTGYSGRSETLTNFPVLLVLSNNFGNSGFTFDGFLSPNGYDLRFGTNASDTSLSYEIERWNTNAGQASYVWVQVPTMPGDGSGSIWATWGNDSTQLACTTNGATWTNNFKGVWHCSSYTNTLSALDSASTNNGVLTSMNAANSWTSGTMGGALSFTGSPAYVRVNSTLGLGTSNATLSCWVNLPNTNMGGAFVHVGDTTGGYGIGVGDNASGHSFWENPGNYIAVLFDGVSWYYSSTKVPTGGWHHVVLVVSASGEASAFLDGASVSITPSLSAAAPKPVAVFSGIGGYSTARYATCAIDDVQVSGAARSTNWIWASYMNQASNAAFNTYILKPYVANSGVISIAPHTVVVSGSLVSTGSAPVTSWGLIYGTNDPGQTLSGWLAGRQITIGSASSAPIISTNTLVGLQTGTTYYYRYWAANSFGTSLADPAVSFIPVQQYSYSMPITFRGYTNRTETLTNFPVLVVLSNNVNGSGFSFTNFVSPNGWDLRFLSTGDLTNTAYLNYEIERWNTNDGQASYVWVQAPTIPSNGTGVIWARWGDPANSSQLACTTNGAVWTNGFRGVWHCSSYTNTLSALDSASTNNGVLTSMNSSTSWTNGQMGGALNFTGATACVTVNSLLGLSTNNVTISCWVNLASASLHGPFVNVGNGTGGGYGIGVGDGLGWDNGNTGNVCTLLYEHSRWITSGRVIGTGWHHVTLEVSALGNPIVFLDGAKLPDLATGAPGVPQTSIAIGGYGGGQRYPSCVIDDVQISGVVRSTNWIWAAYLNEASNTVFSGFGGVTQTMTVTDSLFTGSMLKIQ